MKCQCKINKKPCNKEGVWCNVFLNGVIWTCKEHISEHPELIIVVNSKTGECIK